MPVLMRLCESMLIPDEHNYLDLFNAADRLHSSTLMVTGIDYLLQHPLVWLEKGDVEAALNPYTIAQIQQYRHHTSRSANSDADSDASPPTSNAPTSLNTYSDEDDDEAKEALPSDPVDADTSSNTQSPDFIGTSMLKLEYPDIYTAVLKSLPTHVILEPSRSLTYRQKTKLQEMNTASPAKPFPLRIIIMSFILAGVYQLLLSGSLVTYAMIPAVNVICFIVFLYFMFIHVTT